MAMCMASLNHNGHNKSSAYIAFIPTTRSKDQGLFMKRYLVFFIKVIAVSLVLSQTTTSDTGSQLIGNPLDEPIFLSICGIALLFMGLFRTRDVAY